MLLGHIERGTILYIFEELDGRAISEICEAEFRYPKDDRFFVVRCNQLSKDFDKPDGNVRLNISFMTGPNINTFTGCIRAKQQSGMITIERLSDIESHNRRGSARDEIRVTVRLFSLPEAQRAGPFHRRLAGAQVLSDMIFDISIGGLCVITNEMLVSETDPYYLAEFSLGERDYHILPAKLVRRSEYPRSSIGRYDYGFEFLLDDMPNESSRLTIGIINRKLFGA